jgi:hypothetical protein
LLAAATFVAGCGVGAASSPATADSLGPQLLTGSDPDAPVHLNTCDAGYVDGILVVDPEAGTAIADDTIVSLRTPLMWPAGYRARQAGAQLELLRPDGTPFATTGKRYWIQGGFTGDFFYACGFVLPE